MTRHLIVFVVTFAIGAVIAVVLRTGSHKPYEEHRGHPATGAASAAPATAYDTKDPHAGHASATPAAPTDAVDPHQGHAAPAAPAASAVNTICAICGMPVNPALGTIVYKGKQIGFGCKTCPPKFKADPAKYGEASLKNQVVE